jgi:hypothetical protein
MELMAPLDEAVATDFVNDPHPLSSNAADTTAAATLRVDLMATLPASWGRWSTPECLPDKPDNGLRATR